jgi:hypothetical protein
MSVIAEEDIEHTIRMKRRTLEENTENSFISEANVGSGSTMFK